ncbi:MAG TPA: hypothetical protein PLM00_06755 [Spirochaetota bacterium]|nr:hypothetical protein [Spirochaetota bacterium]HPN83075.1 hypothetical protein [Spirochaetota bacterium]
MDGAVRLYLADRAPVLFTDTWTGEVTERPWGYAGMLAVPEQGLTASAASLRSLVVPSDSRATARAWLEWVLSVLDRHDQPVSFSFLGTVLSHLDGRLEEAHRAAWGTMRLALEGCADNPVSVVFHEARPSQGFAPWTGQMVHAVRYDDESDDAICIRLVDLVLGVLENALHWTYRNDDRELLAFRFLPVLERAMREDPAERQGCSMQFYPKNPVPTGTLNGEVLPQDLVWRYHDPAIRSLMEPLLFEM